MNGPGGSIEWKQVQGRADLVEVCSKLVDECARLEEDQRHFEFTRFVNGDLRARVRIEILPPHI